MPVEGIIEFMGSEGAIAKFGADIAAKYLAHGIELKAAGIANCDCPACNKAQDIIDAFAG